MDTSLNKYISETGFCSRREADKYIDQLRVTINGIEATKGNRVKSGDVVLVDGEPIKKKVTAIYMALNKPKGITCTTDLKDKTNIIHFINYKSRIFPIGRLDKRSEGLIFLTNDGDIVTKTCYVKQVGPKVFKIVLTQGLNRQIRRMCEALNYNVVSLKRIRIMNMTLGNLPLGKWRFFTPDEIETINLMLKNSSKTAEGAEGMDE